MQTRRSPQPVTGLDVLRRGVYEAAYAGHAYAIEVDYFDFGEKIRLYRDGTLVETKKSPARFDTPEGAMIEAAMGLIGMKKLKLVGRGTETTLQPAPGRAEARRAAFERQHPDASRLLAGLAWLVLVVALIVDIPQLIGLVGDVAGFEFTPPFRLPAPLPALIGILAFAAAIDRALRFKHTRWVG